MEALGVFYFLEVVAFEDPFEFGGLLDAVIDDRVGAYCDHVEYQVLVTKSHVLKTKSV